MRSNGTWSGLALSLRLPKTDTVLLLPFNPRSAFADVGFLPPKKGSCSAHAPVEEMPKLSFMAKETCWSRCEVSHDLVSGQARHCVSSFRQHKRDPFVSRKPAHASVHTMRGD